MAKEQANPNQASAEPTSASSEAEPAEVDPPPYDPDLEIINFAEGGAPDTA
jgi:hypothetical protein